MRGLDPRIHYRRRHARGSLCRSVAPAMDRPIKSRDDEGFDSDFDHS
jgi:hypothetical protein